MKEITEITRKDIFDYLIDKKIIWNGRLTEIDFLNRLYDLSKLPSHDSRFKNADKDIWQHRVNNFDWDDYWVYSDSRFNLMYCNDEDLLKFLSEMLHPIVRSDKNEVEELLNLFNSFLTKDNYELYVKEHISDRPIFIGKKKTLKNINIENSKKSISYILTDEYVHKQILLMENSVENSPDIAIGTAKELIESICFRILQERNIEIDKNWDLLKLLKQTTKQIQLTPEGIQDETKASITIKSILGSLTTIVQGIGELRNTYGSGHGKKSNYKGLSPRHAKLAVGASATLAVFLLETHKIRS